MTKLEILKWNEKNILRMIEKEKNKEQNELTQYYIKEFSNMLEDVREQIKKEEDRIASLS